MQVGTPKQILHFRKKRVFLGMSLQMLMLSISRGGLGGAAPCGLAGFKRRARVVIFDR